jgi:hypothetical protein
MSKLLFLLIFLLTLDSLEISAQKIPSNLGAAESGMGGVGVASSGLWAGANNQASLGFNTQYGAGFYYENRFMTKELSLNALSVVVPTKRGSFSANLSYFGYSQYNEKKLGLAYGMPLSKRLAIGVQMDYLTTSIGNNYGSVGVFTFELGLMAKISDDLTLGAHIFNPIQTKLNDYNGEKIPSLLKIGLQWKLDKDFTAALEAQSDIDNKLVLRGGLEYRIKDILYTRIGISNNPTIFSFGVGLQMKAFRLDFSSSMHQTLGYSPQLSLIYQMDK